MFKTFSKTISAFLIGTTAIAGVVFALPQAAGAAVTAASQNSYVIKLYSGQKEQLLTQLPGLNDVTLTAPDTYKFKSTLPLTDLQRTFDGFYQYLDSDTNYQLQALPNDPGFTDDKANIDRQWGLWKADFVDAWAKTTGNRNVIVAIVDTGIDQTHEDFSRTHFVTGYNVLTQSEIDRYSDSDDNGHGTLISGVIAATANNSKGIAGAAPDLTLMPVKALGADGSGSSSDIAQAIIWATDHKANVINLSLGGIGFAHDTILADAITYAFDNGVVIVAAAGNDVAVNGGNLDKNPVFPICDDNGKNMIIGVTATDVNDLKPTFANYGKACVDVSAPGKRILSTINHDPATGGAASDSYAYASGTSLAVPFVSAQAGLLRSLFPTASNKQIRDRIISTAENIDALNLSQCGGESCAGLLGGGRINVEKSLEQQIVELKDGDLVQVVNTDKFYYINGGKKQLVSPFVRDQRFKFVNVKIVSASDLQDFPEGSYAEPVDGTLVKSPNDPTVYYMQAGLRRPLTYQVFINRKFSFSNVVTLTNVEVGSWIEGSFLAPSDGTLLRSPTNPTVYWVINGILHPINYKFFIDRGLSIFPVIYAPDNDIAKFSRGDPYIL